MGHEQHVEQVLQHLHRNPQERAGLHVNADILTPCGINVNRVEYAQLIQALKATGLVESRRSYIGGDDCISLRPYGAEMLSKHGTWAAIKKAKDVPQRRERRQSRIDLGIKFGSFFLAIAGFVYGCNKDSESSALREELRAANANILQLQISLDSTQDLLLNRTTATIPESVSDDQQATPQSGLKPSN